MNANRLTDFDLDTLFRYGLPSLLFLLLYQFYQQNVDGSVNILEVYATISFANRTSKDTLTSLDLTACDNITIKSLRKLTSLSLKPTVVIRGCLGVRKEVSRARLPHLATLMLNDAGHPRVAVIGDFNTNIWI